MNIKGGGADTLKLNLHIIGHMKKRTKKGCEFNQLKCEFKILLTIGISIFNHKLLSTKKLMPYVFAFIIILKCI